jgi:hypothetical protein
MLPEEADAEDDPNSDKDDRNTGKSQNDKDLLSYL